MPWVVETKGDLRAGLLFIIGIASFLLLLASTSAPLIDGVRLFRLSSRIGQGVKRNVDVGIWGYCIVPISGFPGFDPAVVDGCSKGKLGFAIDGAVANALQAPKLVGALTKAQTTPLILCPIVTGLTTFLFFISVAAQLSKKLHLGSPMGVRTSAAVLTLSGVTTLATAAVFIVCVNAAATAKNRVTQIGNAGGTVKLKWGNLIWLTVAALVLHIISFIIMCTMHKERKEKRANATSQKQSKKAEAEEGEVDEDSEEQRGNMNAGTSARINDDDKKPQRKEQVMYMGEGNLAV
ncbi:hypothetical protein BD779DRAFT_98611 [Infundibulicybe gibba]|nr:hypothetical protein BD779DRAFT_98611 [Infundibulicybe gibba]